MPSSLPSSCHGPAHSHSPQSQGSEYSVELSRADWNYSCSGLEVLCDLGSCVVFLGNAGGGGLCAMYVCKMHEASTNARTAKSRVQCSSLLLSHQDPEEGLRHPEYCPSGRWEQGWCHQRLLTQAHILKGPKT